MTELLTAAQMRAIEEAAIASGEVTGLELMERAGRGVVEAIFEEWPELAKTSHRAVVLCGPGNNGGDGFVVARLLKEWGWEVEVFLYGDPEKLPPDARVNYERWCRFGEVKALTEKAFRARHPVHGNAFADLYIDAIFGTGLTRPPEGDLGSLLRHLGGFGGDSYPRLVAVDAPSGLCLDSGKMLIGGWARPRAALTVTFDSPKVGHFVADGPECCGRIRITDIGVRRWRELQPTPTGNPRHMVTRPPRQRLVCCEKLVEDRRNGMLLSFAIYPKRHAHKYTHGHALILSGGAGRGGAARLAARGALRIGAGLVTVGCPPEALTENAARLDAVMLRPVADAEALAEALEDPRINALCLGPGLGTGEREVALVAAALGAKDQRTAPDPGGARSALLGGGSGVARRAAGRSLVLDADALTILSREPDLLGALHERCILTPHAGEFARLFPDIAEKLTAPATKGPAYSKVDATREAAKRAGCVVLYKGPDTVIADPSGRCAINSAHYDRAAPWLATAGSGDVLAGFIAGLLARGFAPMQAAETAAWLHVECALKFGPGLIAEDLPEQLPAVFRDLGL
ncbi:NAD(P)H-hydrate epimerase [Defluviimonas sp. SAOS-178_SWC]|uniref:NAD(P)H-hydrate epimerase n=1 Tax=Defluviimonas sp. SAOS-178_SWC TaxID=3121287 RepID=UPI003221C0BB